MKNVHLIPVPIQDIVIQLENSLVGENEKLALLQRLEVIKDFCIKALNREQRKNEEMNKKQRIKLIRKKI
jgi:hypothetical protein